MGSPCNPVRAWQGTATTTTDSHTFPRIPKTRSLDGNVESGVLLGSCRWEPAVLRQAAACRLKYCLGIKSGGVWLLSSRASVGGCLWCLLFSAVCGVLGAVVSGVFHWPLSVHLKNTHEGRFHAYWFPISRPEWFEQQDECPGLILKYCLGIKSCGCLTGVTVRSGIGWECVSGVYLVFCPITQGIRCSCFWHCPTDLCVPKLSPGRLNKASITIRYWYVLHCIRNVPAAQKGHRYSEIMHNSGFDSHTRW